MAENSFYKIFQSSARALFGKFFYAFWIQRKYLDESFIGSHCRLINNRFDYFNHSRKGDGYGRFKAGGGAGHYFRLAGHYFCSDLSFIIGSIYGIYLLIKRIKGFKDSVPFGPFLVLGSTTLIFSAKIS